MNLVVKTIMFAKVSPSSVKPVCFYTFVKGIRIHRPVQTIPRELFLIKHIDFMQRISEGKLLKAIELYV